jgi:hypothetical protein
MLYSGTDPESYITEYTLVYEDKSEDVNQQRLTTQWLSRFRWGRNLGCYVAKFAPHKALKLIVV